MTAKARGFAELEDYEVVFSALAHHSRRTILSALHAHGGEMTSGAIAGWFAHSWPTTSQHLRVLQEAGLVTVELRGREHIYRVDTARLLTVTRSWLVQFG
ncbi:MAG TPA: metalloregulator ArsR/SmtB family transcription factor [Streptosporangiaceae bacterium]|nr:metalloregulator ArsR/SmtB family transcription factor [Streptosporangiaceae bacterium]